MGLNAEHLRVLGPIAGAGNTGMNKKKAPDVGADSPAGT